MCGSRVIRIAIVGLIIAAALMSVTNCGGGGSGDTTFFQTFAPVSPMTAAEVQILLNRAAMAVDDPFMTVAVVDRVGRPLALWTRHANTDPVVYERDLNVALSIARTAAFMSSSQGPITSRTLEYISTFHFPPIFGDLTREPLPAVPVGTLPPITLDASLASQRSTVDVVGTPQGPLWQIFSSNRGAPYAGSDLVAAGVQTTPPTVFSAGTITDGGEPQRIPPAGHIDVNGNLVPNQAGNGLTYLSGGVTAYRLGVLNAIDPDTGGPTYNDATGNPVPSSTFFPAGANFPGRVVGAVGVYIRDANGFARPDAMEFAANTALRSRDPVTLQPTGIANFAVPAAQLADPENELNFFFPLELVPENGAIFLVAEQLPYVSNTSRPAGTAAGTIAGNTVIAPTGGGLQAFNYIIGPRADPLGNLTQADVEQLINRGIAAADGTRAAIRLPAGSPTKMIFAVTNLDGLILAAFRMEDAPIFSYDVSLTKARCVTYLSSAPGAYPTALQPLDQAVLNAGGVPAGVPGTAGENGVAITTRTLAFMTQPYFPPGIASSSVPGPWLPFAACNADPVTFNRMLNAPPAPGLQSGVIFFPGASPLYKNGQLVGGYGVSGDGVEQDDIVTAIGFEGFEPDPSMMVDQFFFNGIRLPYFKFPQLPGTGIPDDDD